MRARTVLAVVLLLVSGCAGQDPGSGPGSPGDSSADGSQLQGRTFVSASVTGHELVPGTRIMLSFPESGVINADAGCNHLFGDVGFETDKLDVSGMGGTEMGCDQARHEQDQWLMSFLSGKPVWVLSGDELVLTLGETELKLLDREVAEPDSPLVGRRWQVDSLVQGQSVSSVPTDAQAFLEFQEDGTVVGNTGCNSLGGRYSRDEATIIFSEIATTKMACAGDIGALEQAVLAVLDGQVKAEIDADKLRLTHPGGKGLHLKAL